MGIDMTDREIRTILLVDASASMLFYLAMLLKRLEYKVVTAQSAEDAFRMMDVGVPSIICTELQLPQMSGMDFLRKVKATSKFSNIPFVILTSDIDPSVKTTCERIGCAAFLLKPVEPEVLYRSLQSVTESVPRLNIRLNTSLKVIIGGTNIPGGIQRTESVTAISEGGLYIATLTPAPPTSLIPLRIFLKGREINVKALVLYSFARGESPFHEPGMGMKFVEISITDRSSIRAFIKEQLTKDIVPRSNEATPQ